MRLTSDELAAGALSAERLDVVATAFAVTGFVALEGAVPAPVVASIRAAVQADLDAGGRFMQQQDAAGRDTDVGASFFSFEPPFSAPEVVANPILLQVLGRLLGDEFTCAIYNTNVSRPGSRDQQVHQDVSTRWPDGWVWDGSMIAGHVTLCDFTSANGSTELYPGTHRFPSDGDLAWMAARAPELPAVRANWPAGTFFLREPTVWHRGMANATASPREMLSFAFARRGSRFEAQPFGRPLEITPAALAALPPAAQPVWAPNLTQ